MFLFVSMYIRESKTTNHNIFVWFPFFHTSCSGNSSTESTVRCRTRKECNNIMQCTSISHRNQLLDERWQWNASERVFNWALYDFHKTITDMIMKHLIRYSIFDWRPKYNITEIVRNKYERMMFLTIHDWQRSDESQFSCISTNSLGKADGRIQSYSKYKSKI